MKFKTIKFNLYLLLGIISFSCNSISDKGVTKKDYIKASKLTMLKSSKEDYDNDRYKTYLQTFTDVKQIITSSKTLDKLINCDPKNSKYSDFISYNRKIIKDLFPKNQHKYVYKVLNDVDNYLSNNKLLNNKKDNLILEHLDESTRNIIKFCLYERYLNSYTSKKYYDNGGYGIYANYLIKQKTDTLNAQKYFQDNFDNYNNIKYECNKSSEKEKNIIMNCLKYKKYIKKLNNKKHSKGKLNDNILSKDYFMSSDYLISKDYLNNKLPLYFIKNLHCKKIVFGYVKKHENNNILIPNEIYIIINRFFSENNDLPEIFKKIVFSENIETLRLLIYRYKFDVNSPVCIKRFDNKKVSILDAIVVHSSPEKDPIDTAAKQKDILDFSNIIQYINHGTFKEQNKLGISPKMKEIIQLLKKNNAKLNPNLCIVL